MTELLSRHTICINNFCKQIGGSQSHLEPTSWFKPYALHPSSEDIYVGVPDAIFRYDVANNKLELIYSLRTDENII